MNSTIFTSKQECIPVGCVLQCFSGHLGWGGGFCQGILPGGVCLGRCTPLAHCVLGYPRHGQMATEAGGTHPTGMHSWFKLFLTIRVRNKFIFDYSCTVQIHFYLCTDSQLSYALCKWTFYISMHSELNYPCAIRLINQSNLARFNTKIRSILLFQKRNCARISC